MLILAITGVAAALAGLLATPLVVQMAVARGIYDVPSDGRRVHTHPVPRLGGVAVFAAMVCGLVATAIAWAGVGETGLMHQPRFFAGILLGGGLLFAAGLVDDLRGIRPAIKLLAQVLAATVVYALGFQVDVLSLGLGEFSLGWLSLPLTVLWIVGVTNAFNLIDGLDGLATGIALVALLTTLAVAIALGNVEVAVVCVALSGALLGFLRYNFSPAQIFLGDSGSLFVGFMLAVLSVHGSMKSATAVLVVVPLFALALPLLDTGVAIGRRWLRGVPLSGGDARHIHHRLLALGLSHRRAALVMYAAATALAMLGLSLAFAPPTVVTGVAVAGGCVSLGLLLYGMYHLDYHEFAEAGAVLVSGAFRLRRVIQDQIHARDLSHIIAQAETREQLDAVLGDNASNFGFVGMAVCEEMSAAWTQPDLDLRRANPRAWKLDYPVFAPEFEAANPFVLRIWCDPQEGSRPLGALRVARILAPSVEAWLAGYERKLANRDSEREKSAMLGGPPSRRGSSARRPVPTRGVWKLLSAARRATAGSLE